MRQIEVVNEQTVIELGVETTSVDIVIEVAEGGGGSSSGVQSVTGDGVGGTASDVVLTFPTPEEIGAYPDSNPSNFVDEVGAANAAPIQSITGDGVGGTAEDVVLTFPTPAEIGAEPELGFTPQPKFITATATLTTGSWTLVSGLYEQTVSNVNITATSIVDVIPDNADFSTVTAAQILPRTDSASGSVKVYSTNLPSANIGITLNIWN